jgi:acyl-CoA thioester hydrolase
MTAPADLPPAAAGAPGERVELRTPVRPDWLDHNGHMNVAAYLVAFDSAVCAFCTRIGIGPDRIAATGHSVFVGQANLICRREIHAGDRLAVTMRLLGLAPDRVHLWMGLYRDAATGDGPAAVCEQLVVCVRLDGRRPAPFPAEVAAALTALAQTDAALPPPRLHPGAVAIRRPAPPVSPAPSASPPEGDRP